MPQILEESAAQHGLAVLLQEKPFQGANGSGKVGRVNVCCVVLTRFESGFREEMGLVTFYNLTSLL